jgi:hypothetical protein
VNILQVFFDPRVRLGAVLLTVVVFGIFTVYSIVQPDKRIYIPGLLVVDFGILNGLIQSLFFPRLSSHVTEAGGMWQLLTGAILVAGWVLCERTLRRERAKKQTP